MNLGEVFLNQPAVIGEMVQLYAPLAPIMHGAGIDLKIEAVVRSILIHNSKLEEKVKQSTPTGGDIAKATKVGTVNLPLHSFLQSVRMKIARKS